MPLVQIGFVPLPRAFDFSERSPTPRTSSNLVLYFMLTPVSLFRVFRIFQVCELPPCKHGTSLNLTGGCENVLKETLRVFDKTPSLFRAIKIDRGFYLDPGFALDRVSRLCPASAHPRVLSRDTRQGSRALGSRCARAFAVTRVASNGRNADEQHVECSKGTLFGL